MNKVQKTGDAKKGGLLVGDSHADGGMPAIVVDTGQPIEVEGGEVIINKEASKKYWKELSKINQSAGNGVPIPPPADFSGDVSQYDRGGKISLSDLKVGTQMELEHSDTIKKYMKSGMTVEQVARSIAKDHLNENPNYYKILKKLKLAKGGEVVCRSCGNSWLKHQKDVGINVFECESCGSQNFKFYKGGVTPDMSKKEIKEFYDSPEGKKLDAETFKEWDTLVNMSKPEIEEFYNSEEGKEAGLSQEKANELGIDNGRTSARWIMKMKDIDYRNWTSEMWIWAKKQISFIKRMSGNKGSLYDEKGNKTRKHTSLLIWGHNPDKFKTGGRIAITQAQFNERIFRAYKNIKYEDGKIFIEGNQIGTIAGGKVTSTKSRFYAHSIFPNVDSVSATTRKLAVEGLIQNTVEKGFLYNNENEFKTGGKISPAKTVSDLLKALTEAFNKKDSQSFDNIVNKIHEISDNEGLTENEYKQWDSLREKMREFEQERFSKEFKEKYAKGGRSKKANSGGDCYQTAGNIALDLAKGLNSHEFIGTPYVVHAEVAGQGAISGMRYGHAWVEDDVFVYDFSNGRSIIFPKQLYYQLGQVIQKKPKYYKYTFKEARAKMIVSGHYGSWDLKTESGL